MDNLHEIIMKLVGSIEPVGETHTDERRRKNLVCLIDTLYPVLRNIEDVARYNKDSHEASRKNIGELADSFLKNISDQYKD